MPRISEKLLIPFVIGETEEPGTGTVSVLAGRSQHSITGMLSRSAVMPPRSTSRVTV